MEWGRRSVLLSSLGGKPLFPQRVRGPPRKHLEWVRLGTGGDTAGGIQTGRAQGGKDGDTHRKGLRG